MFLTKALDIRESSFKVLRQMGIPKELLYSVCLIPDDIKAIDDITKGKRVSQILEIGSFAGVSTVVLLTLFDKSTICCVDPCLSIKSDAEKYGADLTESTDYYFQALSHHFGLDKRITKIKAFFSKLPDSGTIAYHLPNNPDMLNIPVVSAVYNKKFDLIFIDADHYAESVRSNLELTTKMLSRGGRVILHDVCGKWGPEVQKGASLFIGQNKDYDFYVHNTIGVVSKKR